MTNETNLPHLSADFDKAVANAMDAEQKAGSALASMSAALLFAMLDDTGKYDGDAAIVAMPAKGDDEPDDIVTASHVIRFAQGDMDTATATRFKGAFLTCPSVVKALDDLDTARQKAKDNSGTSAKEITARQTALADQAKHSKRIAAARKAVERAALIAAFLALRTVGPVAVEKGSKRAHDMVASVTASAERFKVVTLDDKGKPRDEVLSCFDLEKAARKSLRTSRKASGAAGQTKVDEKAAAMGASVAGSGGAQAISANNASVRMAELTKYLQRDDALQAEANRKAALAMLKAALDALEHDVAAHALLDMGWKPEDLRLAS